MSTRTYRRTLTPGIVLEATLTEFRPGADTLDAFTLTVFGVVTDLLPNRLKGTEEAFEALGEMEAALWDVVDDKYRVDPREDYEAIRRANLQRWGLLPAGEEIVVNGRRVA